MISIVMAVYNRAETVRRALISLDVQTCKDFEVIIIDGASSDNTVDVIRDFLVKSDFQKVQFVSEKDAGIYDAINKGISMASGDFIMLLHSDDFIFDSKALDILNRVLDPDQDQIVCFPVDIVGPRGVKFKYKVLRPIRFFLNFGHMPPHPGMIVNRSVFTFVGLYDPSFKIAADFEFVMRSCVSNIKFKVVNDYCYYSMVTGGVSSSGLPSFRSVSSELIRIFRFYKFRFVYFRTFFRVVPKLMMRLLGF